MTHDGLSSMSHSANALRDGFLRFFERQGHAVVPSSPLKETEKVRLLRYYGFAEDTIEKITGKDAAAVEWLD